MWNWLTNNSEWIFSGIGVAVLMAIFGWIYRAKQNNQVQKSGKNSTNIQVGGNFTIKTKDSDE